MHSSVEVLRVLPLCGIAPIGRGGRTGQQGFSGAAENKSTANYRAGGSDFLKCARLKARCTKIGIWALKLYTMSRI